MHQHLACKAAVEQQYFAKTQKLQLKQVKVAKSPFTRTPYFEKTMSSLHLHAVGPASNFSQSMTIQILSYRKENQLFSQTKPVRVRPPHGFH
jgi:ribonuclease I